MLEARGHAMAETTGAGVGDACAVSDAAPEIMREACAVSDAAAEIMGEAATHAMAEAVAEVAVPAIIKIRSFRSKGIRNTRNRRVHPI
jgi:hypothetical protein